tara:strand:- start:1276 stop:1572 length:297 start_codon:yes stop_codon:yes gene_type:complete
MKYIFWNTKALEIFSFLWLFLCLMFFTNISLGENDIPTVKYSNAEKIGNISLYRNDTLYLVNNDLGQLVNSIWKLDSDTSKYRPIVILVKILPNDTNK